MKRTISAPYSMALQAICGWLEWASLPVTVVTKEWTPLWALATFISVGSPTMTSFGFGSSSSSCGISRCTP